MVVRTAQRTSAEWVMVQMQIRVPYWRREQLIDEAQALNTSLAALLVDALDRVYPPHPPS